MTHLLQAFVVGAALLGGCVLAQAQSFESPMNAPTIIDSPDQLRASKIAGSWRATATCQEHHPNKSVFTSASGETETDALKGLLFNEQVLTGITARGVSIVCGPKYEVKFIPDVAKSDAAIQQEVHTSPLYGKIMCESQDDAVRAGTAHWSLGVNADEAASKIIGCWVAKDGSFAPDQFGDLEHVDYVFLRKGYALDVSKVSQGARTWFTANGEGTD